MESRCLTIRHKQCKRCFPRSHMMGIDIGIRSDHRAWAVFEVNAFGDLLPGILDAGEDTYTAQLRAALCHGVPQ